MVTTASKNKQNQLLTGYYYQLYVRNDRERKPLLMGDGNDGSIDFNQILKTFLSTLTIPTVLINSDRLIHIPSFDETFYNNYNVLHFKSNTGRFGFGSKLIDVVTHNEEVVDSNKALTFPYHVSFYTKNGKHKNICMFHRFGHGGTKTAFIKEINKFLKINYNYILKTKAIVNEEYRQELLEGIPQKLRYISYGAKEPSSDAADNISGRIIEKYEEEMQISINLKSKRMKDKFKLNIDDRDNPSIIFEDLPDEIFEDAKKVNTKLDMLINGRIKVWDQDGRTMFDYEISDDLEYKLDNHPTDESIKLVFDKYCDKFSIGVDLDVD
jgi:hypothetical protein